MNALYGLIDSQMFNVQVFERCTIPSHSDADGNFIAGRQNQSCIDLLVPNLKRTKKNTNPSAIWQAKDVEKRLTTLQEQ